MNFKRTIWIYNPNVSTLQRHNCEFLTSEILSRVGVTKDGVWIGEWIHWPLMHTTRNCKQLEPPIISTIHISPQHPLSLFRTAVSSPAIPWQRFLIMKILQLHVFVTSFGRLPYRIHLVAPIVFKITPRHGPHRNTPIPTVLKIWVDSLLRERVYRAVA
jgi:hypothetical protein